MSITAMLILTGIFVAAVLIAVHVIKLMKGGGQ
jgi:hypothetical protein